MPIKVRHCQLCKTEIPAERLEAVPETRLCVACCTKVDQQLGGEFFMTVEFLDLTKQNSLKKQGKAIGRITWKRRDLSKLRR